MRIPAILCLVLVVVCASRTQAGDEPPVRASHLTERASELRLVSVEREEGTPVLFTLVAEVAMPEPMWKLAVDSVAPPDETGRVLVKLSGVRPEGSQRPRNW